jgi:hypothetical protein
VVHEIPFEVALRRTYELGIESGVEWMVTVDGDVLPRKGAVGDLLEEASRLPPHYFQIEGLVRDKLMGGFRKAGHRAYRVRYLERALEEIPTAGSEIRPERRTLARMEALGHPSRVCKLVFGLHDFEQYFRDIYRKAYVHSHKHEHWISEVVPQWMADAAADPDFLIAIRGFCSGLALDREVRIDAGERVAEAERAVTEAGLTEKDVLTAEADSLSRIREVQSWLPRRLRGGFFARRGVKIRDSYRRLGLLRTIPDSLGSILRDAGAALQRAAARH